MSESIPVPLLAFPAPHPGAGIERVGQRLMAASPDEYLHSFIDEHEAPSFTGERIVELADGRHTVEQIAQAVTAEFEGAVLEQVTQDVQHFVAQLVAKRVLVLHTHPLR